MKKGDLVEFYTKAWVFSDAMANYNNPGIVLHVRPNLLDKHKPPRRKILEVYWSDGKITKEHDCYLRPACTTGDPVL